jgi:hypothetical protein
MQCADLVLIWLFSEHHLASGRAAQSGATPIAFDADAVGKAIFGQRLHNRLGNFQSAGIPAADAS